MAGLMPVRLRSRFCTADRICLVCTADRKGIAAGAGARALAHLCALCVCLSAYRRALALPQIPTAVAHAPTSRMIRPLPARIRQQEKNFHSDRFFPSRPLYKPKNPPHTPLIETAMTPIRNANRTGNSPRTRTNRKSRKSRTHPAFERGTQS